MASREARASQRGAAQGALLLLLLLLVLLPSACLAFLQPPAAPPSSTALRPRARGTVVCKKGGSSSGAGGGGAAKGFGFGTKKDPKVDKYKYSGKLRPGELGASRLVPADIMRPDYALDGCIHEARVCFEW